MEGSAGGELMNIEPSNIGHFVKELLVLCNQLLPLTFVVWSLPFDSCSVS